MFRYVLFDLDGTLTDPKEGICKCVQYALKAQNIEEPDPDKLEPFIGPPLATSFREFYGMDEESSAEAVKKYRERFESIGLYENELYPGMKEFLQSLKAHGIKLAVASSKPKEFVERILVHFKLDNYFDVVCGSEKNGKKVEKPDVIREALSKLFHVREETIDQKRDKLLPLDEILMVGDRKFDILGAKAFGLKGVGVSYGYAPEGELEEAGADYITDNLEDLHLYITGESLEQQGQKLSRFAKSIRILMPVVYEFILSLFISAFLIWGLDVLIKGSLKSQADWFVQNSSRTAVCFDMAATLICAFLFYRWYQKEKQRPISKVVIRRNRKRLLHAAVGLILLSGFLALFLNIVIANLGLVSTSETYKDVAATQYSVPLWLGLLHYGLLKPMEEELVFRGLVYGRMRRYFSRAVAIPISALVFGAYHGNIVQLIYAFLMGSLLAYVFERYKSLKASFLVHSCANVAVYLTSSIPAINKMVFSTAGCAVTGIVACVLLIYMLISDKKR